MQQRVSQLATFVDGAWGFRGAVARNTAWKRELCDQTLQAFRVSADVRIELAVGTLEVGIRHNAGRTMSGAGHEHHIEIALPDDTVEVRIDQVEPGCCAPVPQEPRLNVLDLERFRKERI